MNQLLKKIYEEILYYEKETVEADRRINREFAGISASYVKKMNVTEKEELESLLQQVSLAAQEEGFLLGMKYMWRLIRLLDRD